MKKRSVLIALLVGLVAALALAQGTPPVPAHIRVNSITAKTARIETLVVDGGSIFLGPASANSMSVNTLAVGRMDAGAISAGVVRVGQVDAGLARVDSLHVGTIDAGIVWLQQARNPDGGLVYIPQGLTIDQGSDIGFRGPGGDSVIHHTGGALTLNAGAGLKVGVVNGFFTQSEATIGQLSPDAVQITGGTTSGSITVVAGTGALSPDAGLLIGGAAPNGPVIISRPSGLWSNEVLAGHVDAGSVYAFAVRTPSIGNRDGGFLSLASIGLLRSSIATEVPFCDGSTVPFGSIMYYGNQWWECSVALAALGVPGGWTYLGQPPVDYEARTPADPQGSSTAAGVAFAARNSGTHYLKLVEMATKVEFAGACTGGCVPGTTARYLIVQRNKQDGGYRELARQQVPCVAPVGFCSMFSATPSTGCVSDGGSPLMALPMAEGGLVELEIQADGGQCTPPPIVSVTGFGYLVMLADGGGV